MKKLIIFSITLIFIYGCGFNQKNKSDSCNTDSSINKNISNIKDRKLINFKHIKDFSINFKGGKNLLKAEQIIKKNNTILIIDYYKNKNSLVFFDIEKKIKIKEIKFPEGSLSSFFVHNKDSVFLLYRPELRKDYNHDSTLLLTDEYGKTFKFYDYSNANVTCPKNKHIFKDSLMYLTQYYYPPVYENNKLFLTFNRFVYDCSNCLGGKEFLKIQLPNVGYVDLQKNKFIGLNKIKYPYLNDSTYYPSGYNRIHLISLQNNKEILISFNYTPLVYKYNYLTDRLTKIKGFKSLFKDSIYASNRKPETTFSLQYFSYNNIIYDKENNRFIRYFNFPYNIKLHSLIFADTSFNVTAEGIIPEGYSFVTSISKDTLLFGNITKNLNTSDSICFSVFTIDEKPGFTQKVFTELKLNVTDNKRYEIKEYIKKTTKTNKKNYAVVIIPVDFSCPGCVKETLHFFSNNIKKISEIPLYLIIASDKEQSTKKLLKNNNLENKPNTVFSDNLISYLNYHPKNKGFNPRLILMENDKVILDKIYDVKEIIKLQDDLIAFLLKHKYIKGYK